MRTDVGMRRHRTSWVRDAHVDDREQKLGRVKISAGKTARLRRSLIERYNRGNDIDLSCDHNGSELIQSRIANYSHCPDTIIRLYNA